MQTPRPDNFEDYMKQCFNPTKELFGIIEQTRNWFDNNGGPDTKAVIGISGGKDSTIAAAILVRALGANRVLGVIMPNGSMSDLNDAKDVIRILGIPHATCNINQAFNALMLNVADALCELNDSGCWQNKASLDSMVAVNIPPRLRMTLLRAMANTLPGGGRLVNTCNASEDYVGYSTKDGDAAGDFSPLCQYTVTELLAMADECLPEIPRRLIHKTPSDGLCGRTDEDALGFTYDDLDRYIAGYPCSDPDANMKIHNRHVANLHKSQPMSYARRQ